MNILKKLSINSRWLRWLGTILSTGLFIWLLLKQNWETLWLILKSLPGWLLPLTFFLYILGIIGNSIRWYLLLIVQSRDITYSEILKTVFAGNFASNFLPSTIGGDTIRIIGAARHVGWSVSLASVGVDRLINVLAMLIFFPIVWNVYPSMTEGINAGRGLLGFSNLASTAGIKSSLFKNLFKSLKRWIAKIIDALMVWQHHPITVLGAFVISVVARISVFLGVWLLAQGMMIDITFSEVISIGAITYLFSMLPISINGFGLREVTMATLYHQLGASLEQASALVLVTRFILMSETLPGALWVSDKLVAKSDGP